MISTIARFASLSTLVFSLLAPPAHAEALSQLSALSGVSVIAGSLVLIASPILIIDEIVTGSGRNRRNVEVRVRTDKGETETISLPKEVCDKADLRAGDRLLSTPNATGALIKKGDQPVAFLVTPGNATLSRNHQLAN